MVQLGRACTMTLTLLDEVQPELSTTVTLMVALPGLRAFQVIERVLLPLVYMPWPVTDQL